MSSLDPGKLKVVELRAELTNRGLDIKGNKPVLVKRLKEALEKELHKGLPDTSIADTSTEDLNSSQDSIGEENAADADTKGDDDTKDEINDESVLTDISETRTEEIDEIEEIKDEDDKETKEKDAKVVEENTKSAKISENGDKTTQETQGEKSKRVESKGEKRRRTSPSPERAQRKRSKSPIREDEPTLDNNKVQLSWYDSDLHLQIDKKSFLSGKPYHEGAFGYAWAGVRATHGVKFGKVCFEVKVTDSLKWEDLAKQSDRKRDNHRSENSRRDRQRTGRDSSKSNRDATKSDRESSKLSDSSKSKTKDQAPADKTKTADTSETVEKTETSENPETVEKMEVTDKTETAEEGKKAEDVEKMEVDEKVQTEEKKVEESKEAVKEEPEKKEVEEKPVEPIAKHLIRIGWSTLNSGLQLGEADYSYAYESTGKFISQKNFVDYGAKYDVGDVVGAYLNISEESVTFTFTVNGELQPEATTILRSDLPQENFSLFPHVLTRNYTFELNFGGLEKPWFPHPSELEDYVFIANVEDKVQGPLRLETRTECEVIMMCGLPASGKTHWVKQYLKDNPEKTYTIVGNNQLLERMTVNGNPLKSCFKGRWSIILDRLMKCINILVETASLRRRNFILDQTNVFPSAQRRKMRLFEGFKRRAVVLVVADEEQAKRRALQEAQDGKDVPDSAIFEMKANMSIPRRGDWLEEVTFVELNEEESKTMIQKYNQQGREAGFGPISGPRGSSYRDNRGHPYRWDHTKSRRDYRGGYRDRYQNNRYDRSRQHGGWQNRRPPPGSWNRDVRRDRAPSGSSREQRIYVRSSGSSSRQDNRSSNRDNRNRNQNSSSYSRNQRWQSNRSQPSNSQSTSWSGQGAWNQGNSWGQGSWSGQAQQWKGSYGQSGYGQGGYGTTYASNWGGFYGQYPNWNSQNNVG